MVSPHIKMKNWMNVWPDISLYWYMLLWASSQAEMVFQLEVVVYDQPSVNKLLLVAGLRHRLLFSVGMFGLKHKHVIVTT